MNNVCEMVGSHDDILPWFMSENYFLSKYEKRVLKIFIVGDQTRLQKGQLEVFILSYISIHIATQSIVRYKFFDFELI